MSRKAGNYTSTLAHLMRSFLTLNGWQAYAAVGFALTAGLVQPIPFAMLGHAGMAASRGEELAVFPGGLQLTIAHAFYAGTAAMLFAIVFSHLADRFALHQNDLWQDRLFAQFMNDTPQMAKPYYHSQLTGMESGLDLVRRASQVVMAVSSFGRMMVQGLRDGASAIVALLTLGWLDAESLAAIIVTIFAFLPFLARQASGVAEAQTLYLREATDVRTAAIELSQSGAQVGNTETAGLYRALYGLPNRILLGLSTINLIAGLALVSVLMAIFLLKGASVETLLKQKLSYFAVLLIFLRSMQSLASVAGRVSRNYNRFAILKSVTAPRLKPLVLSAAGPEGVSYQVSDDGTGKTVIKPGEPVYLLAPPLRFAFQLTGLSNELRPLGLAPEPALVWLSVYPLASGETPSSGPLVIREADWIAAELDGRAPELAKQCVFIAIEKIRAPGAKPVASTAPLVVYDGEEVMAVGEFDVLFSRYAPVIGRTKSRRKLPDEDDDELL